MPHIPHILLRLAAALLLLTASCIQDPESMDGATVPDAGPDDADSSDTDGFQCDDGYEFCTDIPGGAACIDTTTDPDHCGGCGEPCADALGPLGDMAPGTEPICIDGLCDVGCISGYNECGDQCTDLDNDDNHCGQCDNVCGEDQLCIDGMCTIADCPDDTTACGDQCTDLTTDPDHCDTCDNACEAPENADPTCEDGTCSFECTDGATKCGDQCIHTDDDADHCGECGHRCLATCGETEPGTCDPPLSVPDCTEELPLGDRGEGTAEDPYTICTEEHLTEIEDLDAEDIHFALTTDIELTAPLDLIDNFDAILYGQGHTITHTATNVDAGLFGTIETTGEVHNLTLQNVDITGDGRTGGLVQFNHGLITGVTVTGHISGGDETGGLAGRNQGGLITWSTVGTDGGDNTVAGGRNVGGLVGLLRNDTDASPGRITHSTSHAHITNEDDNTGGLVGHMQHDSLVYDSLATGDIDNDGRGTGGLIGSMEGHSLVVESMATGDVHSDDSDTGGLVGRTYDKSKIIASHAEGDTSSEKSNLGGLVGAMNHDSSVTASTASGTVTASEPASGGLIGNMANSSTVNESSASGDIHSTSTHTGGLIGRMGQTSKVVDCFATSIVNGGGSRTAGFVGLMANDTQIIGSKSYGSVENDTGDSTGGLVGRMRHQSGVVDSHAYNPIHGNRYTGGLVGDMIDDASLYRVSAHGFVEGTSDSVGGLVGQTKDNTTVEFSFATGSVESTGKSVGGLIGDHDGDSIRNCFASGDVAGDEEIGGLIGAHEDTLSNCYATGEITGDEDAGGLIGKNGGDVTNSYWDVQSSGIGESQGGEFLVTDDFADPTNFSNWNFLTIWRMPTTNELQELEGDQDNIRPRLRWEFE